MKESESGSAKLTGKLTLDSNTVLLQNFRQNLSVNNDRCALVSETLECSEVKEFELKQKD